MRSRERRLSIALVVTIGVLIAGCTNNTGTAHTDETAATDVIGVAPTVGSNQTETPSTSARNPAPAPVTTSDVKPSATVAVTGGDLPNALVDGYAHNGGDLIDPAEWSSRYGRSGLPVVTGPGVRLVEGLRRMELVDGHWTRTDEAGWLAMSRATRDSTLDSLRTAAGIVGVATTTRSTDQGADCVIDTYPPDRGGVSWQVQGCSYDKFTGLVSLGIARTGPTNDPPASVDSTITTVADTIDGAVTFVEVRFGDPAPDRSTLRLSAHLDSRLDFQVAADTVAHGPLAGWQTFPGDGSLLLSGPTGATWTLSAGVAVFTWSGRW